MTIALLPRHINAIGRLARVRSVARKATAFVPARQSEPAATVNAGRWATLPGEYAGAWACPLDERLPAITAPGTSAPIACGQSGAVTLHLAGAWSGRVVFEGSADGINWRRIAMTSLTGGSASDETDRPGLWRTFPGQHVLHLRLDVAHLSSGAILASVAAAPSVGQPIPRALDPAA